MRRIVTSPELFLVLKGHSWSNRWITTNCLWTYFGSGNKMMGEKIPHCYHTPWCSLTFWGINSEKRHKCLVVNSPGPKKQEHLAWLGQGKYSWYLSKMKGRKRLHPCLRERTKQLLERIKFEVLHRLPCKMFLWKRVPCSDTITISENF